MAQMAEDSRVGTGELHFHGVRGRNREVVLSDTDIRVGEMRTKLAADCRNLLHDGRVVRTVHHQLAITIATGSHRTHQAVMSRSIAHAGGDTLDGGILLQQSAHFQKVVSDAIGIALRREETFHDELLIIEVRKEEILNPCHAEDTDSQEDDGYGECRSPVGNQHRCRPADEAVDGGIHHLLFLPGLLPNRQP